MKQLTIAYFIITIALLAIAIGNLALYVAQDHSLKKLKESHMQVKDDVRLNTSVIIQYTAQQNQKQQCKGSK